MLSTWSWQGLPPALPAAAAEGREMSGVSLRTEQNWGRRKKILQEKNPVLRVSDHLAEWVLGSLGTEHVGEEGQRRKRFLRDQGWRGLREGWPRERVRGVRTGGRSSPGRQHGEGRCSRGGNSRCVVVADIAPSGCDAAGSATTNKSSLTDEKEPQRHRGSVPQV